MAREALTMPDLSRRQPLGVPEILREALKIPRKNGRLMASISLLLLAPTSVLLWIHDRAVLPLVDDDTDDGENFAGRGSHGRLLFLESLFFVAFSAVSLSAMALTVYAASTAYAGSSHHLSLKDAVQKTLPSWKRPAKTCLCVAVITAAYASLVMMFVGALPLVAAGDALMAAVVVLASSAALLYAFLAVVWVLGFAVSVVEDGCCGMDALARAARLVRGRRLAGFLLMLLLLLLLGAPVAMLLYLNTREDEQGAAARVTVGVAATALGCLLKMFAFLVFSVFYQECRRYHGEKLDGGGSVSYELLPIAAGRAANLV